MPHRQRDGQRSCAHQTLRELHLPALPAEEQSTVSSCSHEYFSSTLHFVHFTCLM